MAGNGGAGGTGFTALTGGASGGAGGNGASGGVGASGAAAGAPGAAGVGNGGTGGNPGTSGASGAGLTISPDGNFIYVAQFNQSAGVNVYRTSDLGFVTNLPASTGNLGAGNASSVVFNATGTRAYVVQHNQTGMSRVTALDTTNQGNPTIIGTGSAVPANGTANLYFGSLDMVITPDGQYGIVSKGWNNSLTVMSLAAIESSSTAAGVRTISLGTPIRATNGTYALGANQWSYGPIGMTIVGSTVYIANQWEDTVTALDISDPNPANWGTSAFIAPTVDGLDNPTWIVSGTVNGTTKVFVSSSINPGLVQYRTL